MEGEEGEEEMLRWRGKKVWENPEEVWKAARQKKEKRGMKGEERTATTEKEKERGDVFCDKDD